MSSTRVFFAGLAIAFIMTGFGPTVRAVFEKDEPKKRSDKEIAQLTAHLNDEGIDLFIDRMVLQKGFADQNWPAALKLVSALTKRAEAAGGAAPKFNQNFLNLPVVMSLDNGFSKRVLVNGADTVANLSNCFVISSGSLKAFSSTNSSILFVDGDVERFNSTTNSIIFCSGTIKSFNSTKNNLIFCNGVIESMNYTEGNTIFVRGELRSLNYTKKNVIEATKLPQARFVSEDNTFLNCDAQPAQGKNDRLAKADPSPLALFQYFDPARGGLTFSMVDGDAEVDGVTEGKPYARAGLKKGDLILSVSKAKFMTRGSFVGLLRRQVLTGEALLKVQRDDRVLNLRLQFEP